MSFIVGPPDIMRGVLTEAERGSGGRSGGLEARRHFYRRLRESAFRAIRAMLALQAAV